MLLNKRYGSGSPQATCSDIETMLPIEDAPASVEHHGYRASAGNRWIGLGATLLIYALALVGFFFTVSQVVPVQPPSALTVVNLRPQASPPETPRQEKEALEPVEQISEPERPRLQLRERAIVPVGPISVPLPIAPPKPADPDPDPVQPEAAAPRTLPAPPAQHVASNAPDSWEGRVLAALNKERRYPRLAMARRQQGVPYVRFTMDRQGKVLSSRLERSSGFPDLDREAIALPKRAEPLPEPPDDKPGDTLELVVPVQFFLK